MKFLLFDTSANGQPLNYNASFRDSNNWPRMIHLSWHLMNEKGQILDRGDDLIQPKGFVIQDKMAERHRLNKDQLDKEGVSVKQSVEAFMKVVPEADLVFAHNLIFNQGVVTAEADRTDIIERLSSAESYCLMQEATYYCGIPGKRGKLKWPSLTELHKRVFGKPYANPSYATADLNALGRCFIVMYKTGVLEDVFD